MADEIQLPETFPDYSSQEYWDLRYSSESETTYDWLVPYSQLRSYILARLDENLESEILNIGCGNSTLAEELYLDGFKNITNIDFSSALIQNQTKRFQNYEEMDFTLMDATSIEFPNDCFDLILDKCTLDCILCGENAFQRASMMVQSVYRVLKSGGVYILVSYGMPDTRIGYLKHKLLNWHIEQVKIPKVPLDQFSSLELSQFHYVYICTKYD